MIAEIEIRIPESYADITLRKYLALQKEIKNYEGEVDAQSAVIVQHLTGLDVTQLGGLGKADYEMIKAELSQFLGNIDLPFQQRVFLGEVEYGFEPNLSNMAYGAYVDITKYESIAMDENWAKIMNILYRPITKRVRDTYEIQTYTGDDNYEKWLDVSMDVHFGALFFFVHLSTDLAKGILKFSEVMELHPSIRSILERSGNLIQQSMNLQTEISLNSMK